MLKRLLSVLLVVVLLSGCSTKKDDGGLATGDGHMTAEQERVPLTDSTLHSMEPTGPQPGTQQDLVVNVGDRVFFGYDKFDLQPEARATVERQAEWLKSYPSLSVTIEGHCDERGTREYNLALGEKRAQAVRNYLIALGVDPDRISTVSYGKERPAVLGSSETAWAQNRRGVTVIK